MGRGRSVVTDETTIDPTYYLNDASAPVEASLRCRSARTVTLNQRNLRFTNAVSLPPLPVQRRIADILSAYDDLIENNNRRIAILEEMAQNLYREWFVHFRFPGHEHVKMVDSELGPIPEGWEVKKLGEMRDESSQAVRRHGKRMSIGRKARSIGSPPVN